MRGCASESSCESEAWAWYNLSCCKVFQHLTLLRKVGSAVDEAVLSQSGSLSPESWLPQAIEETFGVDASASAGAVVMAAPGAGGGEAGVASC